MVISLVAPTSIPVCGTGALNAELWANDFTLGAANASAAAGIPINESESETELCPRIAVPVLKMGKA